MKFYLSSDRVGDEGAQLARMTHGGTLAYIPNALDHIPLSDQAKTRKRNLEDLAAVGVAAQLLDLRDFFGKPGALHEALSSFTGVWITGGNTFVLRQAMRLSNFDEIIHEFHDRTFLYGGYSAGVCVLAPSLDGIRIVDDPSQLPYAQLKEPIWEGLHLLDYIILPHFRSDHPESADIARDFERCKQLGIPFRTLRDGEVLYGDDLRGIKRNLE